MTQNDCCDVTPSDAERSHPAPHNDGCVLPTSCLPAISYFSFVNMLQTTFIFLICVVVSSNAFHVAPSTILRVGSNCRRAAITLPSMSTCQAFPRTASFALHMSTDEAVPPPDPLIVDTSEVLGRVSWLSWWCQVILSVVASVTLMFARNVTSQSNQVSTIGPGFVLAGTGTYCVAR